MQYIKHKDGNIHNNEIGNLEVAECGVASTQHTAREWVFEEEQTSNGYQFSVYNQDGTRITAPYISEGSARLIASAPVLLQALKLCYTLIRRDGVRPGIVEGIRLHERADEAARTAIALATGEPSTGREG